VRSRREIEIFHLGREDDMSNRQLSCSNVYSVGGSTPWVNVRFTMVQQERQRKIEMISRNCIFGSSDSKSLYFTRN
jgi:hypothetical protein